MTKPDQPKSKVFPELTNEEAALGAVKTYLMLSRRELFDTITREVIFFHETQVDPCYCTACGLLAQPVVTTGDEGCALSVTSACCDAKTSTNWSLTGPEWVYAPAKTY